MLNQLQINQIKKAELHCHLLGLISPTLLTKVSKKQTVLIDPAELQSIYPVIGTEGFTKWLEITKPYQSASVDAFLPILEEHITGLIKQKVVYAEIMLSPTMFPMEINAIIDQFKYFRHQVDLLERQSVQIEFLMVIPRTLPESKLRRDVITFKKLFHEGFIKGVAIVGLENGAPLSNLYPYLSKLKDVGMGIEIHVGEHGSPEAVAAVVTSGLADRIGHGVSAFQDFALISELASKQIHMEFCVSSNLATQSIPDIECHPISKAKFQGVNFSINTDDPGIFGTSMDNEFCLLSNQFGFGREYFETIFDQTLAARFCQNLRYM